MCGKVLKKVVLPGLFDCGFQIHLSSEAVPKLESDISSVTWQKGNLLSQWLTFKFFGITYLVGKIKFELLFHGPLAE